MFLCMDEALIAETVRAAQRRVVLCAPGFSDLVGTALIDAHRRLPQGQVLAVVDGTDKAARLGYGHFEAVFEVVQAGVQVRLEQGLRLGVLVADERAWCFAAPPLLVDATMEQASAPNALTLEASQIQPTLSALGFGGPESGAAPQERPGDPSARTQSGQEGTTADGDLRAQGGVAAAPVIGRTVATPENLRPVQERLINDPPQVFDVARKVQVFNSFVDFVEIEMTGTQLANQKVALPPKLLLSVADEATRKRLTTSFSLISPQARIAEKSKELRQAIDAIRKIHTRSVAPYGVISLRRHRKALEEAISGVQEKVKQYSAQIKAELEKEINKSRQQLVESFLPTLAKKPPEELQYSVEGKLTKEQVRLWIHDQLDRCFPAVDSLLQDMTVRCVIKSVTYEMLREPKFQELVRKAYPNIDWSKPFEEFSAAPAPVQSNLGF